MLPITTINYYSIMKNSSHHLPLLLLVFITLSYGLILQVHCQCSFGNSIYNVLDFGATGDGSTDDTQGFEDAWKATCNSKVKSPATMFVPSGSTFLLQPIIFDGPCKSDVNVVIDGTLIAPSDPSDWKCKDCHEWIGFHELNNLCISGSGTINGRGTQWWGSNCKKNKSCMKKPTGFVIQNSNNVQIRGLSFMDSPKKHIGIEMSTWIYARNLTITAPEDSPNTDGIHNQHSQHVFIDHTRIATGDDCISIGDGSAYLNISSITCGPGHGISVGSLGKDGKRETVEHVYVSNVELRGTSNGVRIKTWQGGKGYATDITFDRINTFDAKHPIIIDQFYCDHEHCTNQKSAVEVSNVRYNHIHGTARGETAVEFSCSETVPCKDIYMNDINLQSTDDAIETMSLCQNVQGTEHEVSPTVPCFGN